MFCNNGLCSNNSTNFNNPCGCNRNNSCGCNRNNNSCGCNRSNSCGCSRSNFGCGWYCCPNSMCSNMPTTPTTPTMPTVNLGHFSSASALAVGANAVIPLTLTRQVGTDITSSGTGALLQPGTYEVSFALTGTSATTGTTTVGAQLNGVNLPAFSQSTNVATENEPYNLSGVGTIAVTSPNSILNLVNLGANSQDFTDVNLVVKKIV